MQKTTVKRHAQLKYFMVGLLRIRLMGGMQSYRNLTKKRCHESAALSTLFFINGNKPTT
jgi:hypothetical protein